VQSNLVGFVNILDEAKNAGVKTFVYASSSSVYGKNEKTPFSVEDRVDNPISLYAATKKSNELIAHVYNHLFGMHCTGLRFFTVYGPYGRPDMALFLFANAISRGEKISVFNYGKSKRDFTYIDDIVNGILTCLEKEFAYEVFNLGNSSPVELEHFISLIEQNLGKSAIKEYMPLQPGDVVATFADIDYSKEKIGFAPQTSIEEGVKKTIEWYKEYYQV
jgi:UDP-glucuronate 4-epimerase